MKKHIWQGFDTRGSFWGFNKAANQSVKSEGNGGGKKDDAKEVEIYIAAGAIFS